MNYLVEGLQGSGKSTLVGKLQEKYPGYTVYREGDYSPIELAWCALVSKEKYEEILEISPRCSLEGLMLKLKLQYFGHLMQRVDSLEKTLMLGGIVGRRRRG